MLDLDYNDRQEWDGIDLTSLFINSETEIEERSIYWNLKEKEYAYRQGKWKLIWQQDKAKELYDVESDPQEERNIASHYPDIVDNLTQKILEEQNLDNRWYVQILTVYRLKIISKIV